MAPTDSRPPDSSSVTAPDTVAPSSDPTTTAAPTTTALSTSSLSGRLAVQAVGCDEELRERYNAPTYVLCTMNIDGTGAVQLSSGLEFFDRPEWSPDGTRLQWTEGHGFGIIDILTADPDGGNRHWITDGGSWAGATWLPDGGQLAIWLSDGSSYVVGASATVLGATVYATSKVRDAGGYKVLGWEYSAYSLDWSPDGKSFVFDTRLSPTTGEFLLCEVLVSAAADGSNLQQLTPTPTEGGEGLQCAQSPRWSPDGSTIAFVSSRQGVGGEPGGLFLMDPDGSNVRPLGERTNMVTDFSWSPDGKHLIYAITGETLEECRLVVTAVDGSQSIDIPAPAGLRWEITALDWG